MKPYWSKSVHINASVREHGRVDFSIDMGLTGPEMTMSIGDERVVIASRWNVYTTDHGAKQLSEAFEEGLKFLREMK